MIKKRNGKKRECKLCGFKFSKEDLGFYSETEDYIIDAQPCPSCGELYPTKPESERTLFLLQDLYYQEEKNPKVLKAMEDILIKYASSLIKKNYIKAVSGQDDILKHAKSATSRVMQKYIEQDDYRMYASFAGLLLWKIKESIYEVSNRFMGGKGLRYSVGSLDEMAFNQASNDPNIVIDDIACEGYSIEPEIENKDKERFLLEEIQKVINEDYVFDDIECLMFDTEYLDLMRLTALNLFLEKGSKKIDELFSCFGNQSRDSFNKTLFKLKNLLI